MKNLHPKHSILFHLFILFIYATVTNQQKLVLDDLVNEAPNFIPGASSNVSLDSSLSDNFSDPTTNSTQSNRLIHTPTIVLINDISITIEWQFEIGAFAFRAPSQFAIELASGKYSEEFMEIDRYSVEVGPLQTTTLTQTYTLNGLQPTSWYRIRIVPIFSGGPGLSSYAITFTTLRSPVNYWEPLLARRSSLLSFGRGFSDPVQDRPHLSPGVEIFEKQVRNKELPQWFSDSPTRESPVIPSGRRGHSLTLIEDNLFMFGGRTNG